MLENDTTTSVLDPTQSLRTIRSHRRPVDKRPRKVVLVLAFVMAVSGSAVPMATSSATPASPAATASLPVTDVALADRGTTVSRSARAPMTRKQKIEKVIAYAMAQRGDRYQWGASGPNRWDCSGLVSVAMRKAGVKLPHFTGGIQKKGHKVSRANLKRGDIVFPQRGHVGIYLGGGKMIHASSGKGRVVVAKVYGFYTARRVI